MFARFKRADTNNGEHLVAAYMKIDQLQRDISALQERCAHLEDPSYSPYTSYQSSVVDIIQGHRQVDVMLPQSTAGPTEDSDSKCTTMDVVVQVWVRHDTLSKLM